MSILVSKDVPEVEEVSDFGIARFRTDVLDVDSRVGRHCYSTKVRFQVG